MSGMKEQIAQHRYQGISGRSPAQGTTREHLPASPHGTGHSAGWHGEDQPCQSGEYTVRSSHGAGDDDVEDVQDDDDLYPRRTHRSAIRYRSTMTTDQQLPSSRQAVTIYRAHRPHNQAWATPPRTHPATTTTASQRGPTHRRVHWLVYVGLTLFIMLLGWVLLSQVSAWWQVTQDDWHYGRPRTFQADAVVGHNDSVAHPSHFIVLNYHRRIEIIEFPGGDASHAKIYFGPTLIGTGEDLAAVTITFKDVNGDSKLDLILNIQDSHYVLINDQGAFRPAKPGETVSP